MSIFSEHETESNPIDQLVGEGKKYATVEDLAKAYLNADQFIERIKTENRGMREDLERIQREASQRREPAVHAPEPNNAAVEPEKIDLDARIREALEQADRSKKVQSNIEQVTEKLLEVFGDETKANEVVKQKARELGVSVEFLQETAASSPKGFYTLIGLDSAPRQQASAAHNEVSATALARKNSNDENTPGTKAYFDKIRRENPSQYWSPSIQNAIFKARSEGIYQI